MNIFFRFNKYYCTIRSTVVTQDISVDGGNVVLNKKQSDLNGIEEYYYCE